MRILYLDCFSGIAGDMLLGASLDAGLPLPDLEAAVERLLPEGARISADRVIRSGISATKFRLHESGAAGSEDAPARTAEHDHHHHHDHDHDHDHGHDHEHGHDRGASGGHPTHVGHRTIAEIHEVIDQAAVSETARQRVKALFDRLAAVEAAVHQMPLERIHLHEVGALDSIVDIVGCVVALEWFGADRVVCSPLNVGGGTVECAHGTMPVPAPATLRLLEGASVYSSGPAAELVTPTGALLATAFAESFGPLPAMRVQGSGYGAGDRDFPGRPNVLRAVVGEADASAAASVAVLECEIDDMNPQVYGVLMERLHGAGALDVYFTPVQMKKNRPGVLVTVVAAVDRREALSGLLFAETTTIGVRWSFTEREVLERDVRTVESPLGTARVKVARRDGRVVNAAPEFEDCRRLAEAAGVPLKQAHALIMHAYLAAQGEAGADVGGSG